MTTTPVRPPESLPCPKPGHIFATCDEKATRQVGLIGVVETYRCDGADGEPCDHTYQIRSWAEALDCGFAPEPDDD